MDCVYITKMQWLALSDEILINTINDAKTFERLKRVRRAHYRRLTTLEDQFYAKLLGNRTSKELYQAKQKECAYLVSYEAQDGGVSISISYTRKTERK